MECSCQQSNEYFDYQQMPFNVLDKNCPKHGRKLVNNEKNQMSTTNIKIDSNLENVNDLLFQQIKQLSTASVDSKNIKQEIDKSKAMANMAAQIVNSTKLQFDVVKKFGFNNQPTAITDQSE